MTTQHYPISNRLIEIGWRDYMVGTACHIRIGRWERHWRTRLRPCIHRYRGMGRDYALIRGRRYIAIYLTWDNRWRFLPVISGRPRAWVGPFLLIPRRGNTVEPHK